MDVDLWYERDGRGEYDGEIFSDIRKKQLSISDEISAGIGLSDTMSLDGWVKLESLELPRVLIQKDPEKNIKDTVIIKAATRADVRIEKDAEDVEPQKPIKIVSIVAEDLIPAEMLENECDVPKARMYLRREKMHYLPLGKIRDEKTIRLLSETFSLLNESLLVM